MRMQDDAKALSEYGLRQDSKLLITRGAEAGSSLNEAEEKIRRIEKLKKVADRLAGRSGRGLTDDHEFSLENQVRTSFE